MRVLESLVIGAGQAGLSASHHLARFGVSHVVLDANSRPGGAWQHRWDSLTMSDVHGVADLPDAPAPGRSSDRANQVIPTWFAHYENAEALPVERPVQVDAVRSTGSEPEAVLEVNGAGQRWLTRTLVNATGPGLAPSSRTCPAWRRLPASSSTPPPIRGANTCRNDAW